MKRLNIILLLCASVTVVLANRQMLTTEETLLKAHLESICWNSALSDKDIGVVKSGISSQNDEVAGTALVVALVHEVENLKGLLESGVGPTNGWSSRLASTILIQINGGANISNALSSVALYKMYPVGLKDTVTSLQLAIRAIVIRQARDLRNGVRTMPETNGLQMTDFDAELLRYSQMSTSQAVSNILERVRSTEIATTKMYALTEVLSSYAKDGTDAVLREMDDPKQVSKYGKIIFLRYLEAQSAVMSESDKRQMKSIVVTIDRSDKDVARACENIEQHLARSSQNNN